jgi:hypothetical protein
MKVDLTTCQNFEQALGLEWLETNGRGGFSSGTVGGCKYTPLPCVAADGAQAAE